MYWNLYDYYFKMKITDFIQDHKSFSFSYLRIAVEENFIKKIFSSSTCYTFEDLIYKFKFIDKFDVSYYNQNNTHYFQIALKESENVLYEFCFEIKKDSLYIDNYIAPKFYSLLSSHYPNSSLLNFKYKHSIFKESTNFDIIGFKTDYSISINNDKYIFMEKIVPNDLIILKEYIYDIDFNIISINYNCIEKGYCFSLSTLNHEFDKYKIRTIMTNDYSTEIVNLLNSSEITIDTLCKNDFILFDIIKY